VTVAVDWNRQGDNDVALPMSRDEARQCVARIARHLKEARALLLELYEREGWRGIAKTLGGPPNSTWVTRANRSRAAAGVRW